MFSIENVATLYVSQKSGNDNSNGFAPVADEYGNAPLETIGRAIAIIREYRQRGLCRPMTVSVVGDYYTSEPIVIEKVRGVTLEPFGEKGRIIGGVRIDGWVGSTFNGVGCLCATAPEGTPDFTDLYVGGKRASVTRYPKSGTLRIINSESYVADQNVSVEKLFTPSKWFLVDKSDLEGLDNISDSIINYYHYWVDEHSPVESYDKESGKLTMKYLSRFLSTPLYGKSSAVDYYLTNIPNSFSNAGEWYLDRKCRRVYYIPTEKESAETIEAFAPVTDKLFIIKGEDIRIRGFELTCTASDYASKKWHNVESGIFEDSDILYGSDIQSVCWAPGAICFEGAVRCSVSDCIIHGLGVHGIEIGKSCRRIRIEKNDIYDTSAGGIKVEGGCATDDASLATTDCVIRENHIHHGGTRYAAGCGILVRDASDIEISENEIHDFLYTGISVGWIWGYAESMTYGNIIRKNHIYNIGNGDLSDMGGIYMLGRQSGTVISENRVHDVRCHVYGAWGIYLDEGSSNMTVENNVVYNTGKESVHLHYGRDNVIRNNMLYGEGSSTFITSKIEEHNQAVLENNIMLTRGADILSVNWFNVMKPNLSRNLICDTERENAVMVTERDGKSFRVEEWESLFDRDCGNVEAAPRICGLAEHDFTLSPESPAIKLGFKPLPECVAKPRK